MTRGVVVAPVQVHSKDRDRVLMNIMTKLMVLMVILESTQPNKEAVKRTSDQGGKAKVELCYRQEMHLAQGCA